jgi:hypothetical protein
VMTQTRPAFVLVWLLGFYVVIGLVETAVNMMRKPPREPDAQKLPPG